MTDENAGQYADSRKLAARARLNRHYTVAETPWFSWVAQQIGLRSGQAVLDVGCGPGWFWSEVANDVPDGLHLTLTDLSPGMVREAKERCSALPCASLQARQADATALPFAEESFDTVIAMHMLYHVADPAAAIAEMHRVLKPGGLLAATTNGLDNMRALYELATAFGGSPYDPVAAIFGYDEARRMMTAIFGNVTVFDYPARLRVTDPEDVFLALTSFPPGETASEAELDAFRQAIGDAFHKENGMLECRKQTGLFLSRKTV